MYPINLSGVENVACISKYILGQIEKFLKSLVLGNLLNLVHFELAANIQMQY